MEFNDSLVLTERVLALICAFILTATALIEFFSPLSQNLRAGRPWVVETAKGFFILRGESRLEKIPVSIPQRREMEGILKGLGVEVHDWRHSPKSLSGSMDRFLWRMKTRALRADCVDLVSLSGNPKTDQELAAKLLYPHPRDLNRAVVTEIMNASQTPGLALKAEKVLRLSGVDVVGMGNSAETFSQTVVYDRTGNPEAAWQVWKALGCSRAREETLVDSKDLVDVSVFLAADCPLSEGYPSLSVKRLWRDLFFGRKG